MCESVEVLVDIDETNRIYYTEDRSFALNDRAAIAQAQSDYANLVLIAQANGYQIIKKEKNITPMDDGIMTEIDKKINELAEPGPSFGGR